MVNLETIGIQQIMATIGQVVGLWQEKVKNRFFMDTYILEGQMTKNIKWNNRHEYAQRQTPTVKKADTNYFETWLTKCAYYAKLQIPPPLFF